MPFTLAEVDVTSPLVPVRADPGDDGLGLLLRDAGRPLAFLLVDLPRGGVLDVPALERLVMAEGAEGLVAERVRRALLPPAPAPPPVTVTVAVCTRDRPEDLARCLTAIRAARGAQEADLLVVDNAPPNDRTRQEVARHPGVRYAVAEVPGLDVGRNRALAEARGEWLVFVDDDVRVDPGWLEGLQAALAEHPDADAVTGLVLPAELRTDAQLLFERRGGFRRGCRQQRWDGRSGGGRLHPLGAGLFGAGCNMAFRTSAVRALGGFDEALDTGPPLPGGGDLDAFYRVLAAGRVLVYEPRMLVFHRHRRQWPELQRQYRSWGTGFAAFLGARWAQRQDRAQVARMVVWWLRYMLGELATALRWREVPRTVVVLEELWGGVTGLPGGYRRSQERMRQRRDAVARARA